MDSKKRRDEYEDHEIDVRKSDHKRRDRDDDQRSRGKRSREEEWSPYAREYNPLQAGSIDGTDSEPHDRAISRAIVSHYEPPHGLESDPKKTLMVARLGPEVTDKDLREFFNQYGEVKSAKVILDVVTGHSMRYGFVEMKSKDDAYMIVRRTTLPKLKDNKIFVDFEAGRTMKGWKPRRLGGGFGGRKESGQLRFGGADRPFRKPIVARQK